jgi:hypothetical protein
MQKYYVKLGLKEKDSFFLMPLPRYETKEGLKPIKLQASSLEDRVLWMDVLNYVAAEPEAPILT